MKSDRPDFLSILELPPAKRRSHWFRNLLAVLILMGALAFGAYYVWYEKLAPMMELAPVLMEMLGKGYNFGLALEKKPELIHQQQWFIIEGKDSVVPDTMLDPKKAAAAWALALRGAEYTIPLPDIAGMANAEPVSKKTAPIYAVYLDDANETTKVARLLAIPPSMTKQEIYDWAKERVKFAPSQRAIILDGRAASVAESDLLWAGLGIANTEKSDDHLGEIRIVGNGYDHLVVTGPKESVESMMRTRIVTVKAFIEDIRK